MRASEAPLGVAGFNLETQSITGRGYSNPRVQKIFDDFKNSIKGGGVIEFLYKCRMFSFMNTATITSDLSGSPYTALYRSDQV